MAAILAAQIVLHAQQTYTIKADSVKLSGASKAELILENSTRGIEGFLYNRGGGRTEFKKVLLTVNDSTYLLGKDTLKLSTHPSVIYTLNNLLSQNSQLETSLAALTARVSALESGGGTITPPAPTNLQVNDATDVASWTLATGYGADQHEYSTNYSTGSASWATATANSVSVGNVSIPAGGFAVRVKAAPGRNSSAPLLSTSPFTVSSPSSPNFINFDVAPYSNISQPVVVSGTDYITSQISPNNWWGLFLVGATKLPQGTNGSVYIAGSSVWSGIGLKEGSNFEGLGAFEVGFYVDHDDNNIIRKLDAVGNNFAYSGIAALASSDYRIQKSGANGSTAVYKLQQSSDNWTTVIDLFTYNFSQDVDLYPAADMQLRSESVLKNPRLQLQ